MSQVAGKYELIKNENFVAYLVNYGVPEDQAKEYDARVNTIEVTFDGKHVVITGNYTVNLTLDQEVEEKMPRGDPLKSTTKMNGSTLTVTSVDSKGKIGERIYEFSADGLKLTLKTTQPPGPVAVRTYKRT